MGSMRELQKEISEWHYAKFGENSNPLWCRIFDKLYEEVGELEEAYCSDNEKDEIADVAIVISVFASRRGLDLEDIMRDKFERVKLKYPVLTSGDKSCQNESK